MLKAAQGWYKKREEIEREKHVMIERQEGRMLKVWEISKQKFIKSIKILKYLLTPLCPAKLTSDYRVFVAETNGHEQWKKNYAGQAQLFAEEKILLVFSLARNFIQFQFFALSPPLFPSLSAPTPSLPLAVATCLAVLR